LLCNLKYELLKIKPKSPKSLVLTAIAAPSAHTSATVAAAPVKASALKAQQAPVEVQAKKVDPAAEMQADKAVRAQRQAQAQDQSQLNYSFDKQSSTLSVKVVNQQSGQFIRQLDFKGFHAMEFSTHGYKGHVVDNAA
jgi:uncharacterized FlaG/YvyC family protein